ncbi:hypothetical protein BDQ17DRAFT_1545285 [Cyathus striatus]|nr:hypothetical protein BDQ17DRAFT_1545285 [Cyathus striatus]
MPHRTKKGNKQRQNRRNDASANTTAPESATDLRVAMETSTDNIEEPGMGTGSGEEYMDDAEEPLAGPSQIDMTRRSLAEKVSGILPVFKEAYISPFDMFICLLDENNNNFRTYRTELYKEHNTKLFSILNTITASNSGREKLVSWLKSPPGADLLEEIVEQEMDTLCSDYKLKGLNDITPEYIEDREPDVFIDDAPFTMGLLRCAAQTKRQEQKNVKKKPDQVCNAIMRQLLYQRSGRCLGFAAQFGLYLWATGSARSTIEAIHCFGLSICYQSVLNILGTLGKWCMDLAKTVASGPHAFCYDNLNISTSIHVERGLSSTPGKVTSGTLGILYKIPNATPDTMALQPILERMCNPMYSGLDFMKDLTLTDDQLDGQKPDYHTLYIALTQILEGIVLSAWKKICAEEGSTLEEYTSSTPTSEDLHNKAGIVLENYLTPLPPVYAAQEVNDDNANSSHKASNVPSYVSCGDQDDPSRDKAHQNLRLLIDVMRDILIVNPSGIPGHFIATDTNMEYTIRDVKDLIVIKGLQTTWDQIGDTSATIAYLKEIKRKISHELELPHQNKGHSDVETKHLIQWIVNRVEAENLLTFKPNRTGNNHITMVSDLLEEGAKKLRSSSLGTFNTKFKNFVAGMVTEEESDDLLSLGLTVAEME